MKNILKHESSEVDPPPPKKTRKIKTNDKLTAKNQMFFVLNYEKKILYTYPSDQELGP